GLAILTPSGLALSDTYEMRDDVMALGALHTHVFYIFFVARWDGTVERPDGDEDEDSGVPDELAKTKDTTAKKNLKKKSESISSKISSLKEGWQIYLHPEYVRTI
ncbi:hypothetical protein V498_01415, partial [Pseudogymnoascus sp. VKM F-4517 (FW-2822)]